MHCLDCGRSIPSWRIDVYCDACLDQLYEQLAEALLDKPRHNTLALRHFW